MALRGAAKIFFTGQAASRASCSRSMPAGKLRMTVYATDCGGRGRKVKDACPECKGAGTVPYAKELKIKVPAGIDDGTRIRLAGEGMPGVGGGTNGDL